MNRVSSTGSPRIRYCRRHGIRIGSGYCDCEQADEAGERATLDGLLGLPVVRRVKRAFVQHRRDTGELIADR